MKTYLRIYLFSLVSSISTPLIAQAAIDGQISIQQRNIEISGAQGQLTLYPAAICQLQNVEFISLSGHNFAEVPDCISQNGRTLRILRLSNNAIQKLSPNIFQLNFLEELDLSNNKLTTNNDDWTGLSKIRILNLKNNPITELPPSVGQLTTLEVLYLANTQITKLPDSLSNLTSLRVLDLGNTKLSITPKAFASLVNLEKLNLSGVTNLTPAEKNVISAIFKGRPTEITFSP